MGEHGLKRIVVVDDEAPIISALERALSQEESWEVLGFTAAELALDYLRTQSPDLIISDERMPGMQGSEFLGKIRQSHPDVPRIILTGYADQEATIRAINDAQVFRYMQKPWDNDDLIATVKLALEHATSISRVTNIGMRLVSQKNELADLNAQLAKEAHVHKATLDKSLGMLKQLSDDRKNFHSDLVRLTVVLTAVHQPQLVALGRQIMTGCQKVAAPLGLTATAEFLDAALLAGLLSDAGNGINSFFAKLAGFSTIVSYLNDMKENVNGTGPRNLASAAISLEGRILRVVHDYFKFEGRCAGSGGLQLAKESYRLYDAKIVAAFQAIAASIEADLDWLPDDV